MLKVSAAQVKAFGRKVGLDLMGITSSDPFLAYVKSSGGGVWNREDSHRYST